MSLYYFGNYRTEEQLADMRRLEAEGICIFCPQHLTTDPDHRVEYQTRHWAVVANKFPYTNTRLHYLLVPDEHVTDMADLSAPVQQDFWTALTWLRERHQLTYYGLAVRNGESEFSGGTIRHLH
ncbi:MAG TPA: HIT domain-containing protein, partial [Micromonosporaceae bacterium]